MKTYRFLFTLLACSSFVACGGSSKPPEPVDVEVEDNNDDYDSVGHIGATAEVGALPEEDTVYAFRESFEGIQECFIAGVKRIDYLGGEISFQVWVGDKGSVQTVFAETSTLGDRKTEQCMFDTLRKAPWPAPVGGPIGVAQNAFEFEMTGDVRPPVPWEDGEVSEALAESQSQIQQCKRGSMEKFLATVYVGTDGTPLSVGMSAPNRHEADKGDCLVDVVSQMTFPSPGSWPAKVSFYL